MTANQYGARISTVAMALALGSVMAAAQAPEGGMPNPSGQQPGQMGIPTASGTPGMGSDNVTPQQMADQSFVKDTLQGDDAQVKMSQLARQKSSSEDVKQFSQQMVNVQSKLNDQLQPLAKQLNLSPPKGPGKKEKQEIARLQALSGPDFDTAYIQAMAKAQEQSLKEFKNESGAGQGSVAMQAAKMDEPVLTQNYEVLKKIAQAHNIDLESKK